MVAPAPPTPEVPAAADELAPPPPVALTVAKQVPSGTVPAGSAPAVFFVTVVGRRCRVGARALDADTDGAVDGGQRDGEHRDQLEDDAQAAADATGGRGSSVHVAPVGKTCDSPDELFQFISRNLIGSTTGR